MTVARRQLLFTDPFTHSLLLDWDAEARQILGQFRANTATYPGDPRATALIDALHDASAEFRAMWAEHPLTGCQPSRKRFNHVTAGRLDLDYVKLTTAEDTQQNLVVFLPADTTTADESDTSATRPDKIASHSTPSDKDDCWSRLLGDSRQGNGIV